MSASLRDANEFLRKGRIGTVTLSVKNREDV